MKICSATGVGTVSRANVCGYSGGRRAVASGDMGEVTCRREGSNGIIKSSAEIN